MLRLAQIDTRGMSCPHPILMTKQALEVNSTEIAVLVDSKTAKSNVERYLNLSGYTVNTIELDGETNTFEISAKKK
ncbi:sulfurtransferase TusA family protein [Desulfosporosinus shakirovi]|uniref:sulfurtransferase TusA family protein n=1 Tax=Desulfosporosinus shakirovi TaxID=2885154 RepID=UPI001E29B993|nr:sulfurtransferase TusA family protein [Desulfosporosinus sp. SRJS8]MCB8814620.1 sulfurtransferase TusA family protein [Desulfosporosinus sp. SRJS8]